MVFKIQTLRNEERGWTFLVRLWNQTRYSFKWFCKTTTLHGFRYITSKESSMFTRIFFAFASCLSLILCGYLTVLQIFAHQQNSILTTVRSTAYPVWKIPFPSVTICNSNVVYKDNINSVFKAVKARGVEERIFMSFVKDLSSLILHDNSADMNRYDEVLVALEQAGYTTDRLMAELAHPCSSMAKKCYWQSEVVKCSEIFQAIKTSHGYCCSFNYYGINTNVSQQWQYQYAGGAGPPLGLRVFLDIEKDQYIAPIIALNGFKVLVQDGTNYPDMDLLANTLLSAEELTISVIPRIFDSSENIRSMAVARRNCLFEDEDALQWSSIYSFETCIAQCRAKTILQYCNCIPYYYYPVNDKIRFCTLLDEPCLKNNKYSYEVLGVTDSFLTAADMASTRDTVDVAIQCSCHPPCNEKIFDFQTDRSNVIQMDGFEYTNLSILNVYFNTVGCIQTSRDSYYTWDHVFASVGGVFGLCLGGSLISILECLFFFGKCILIGGKRKSKVVKHEEPEIYVSDFALLQKF